MRLESWGADDLELLRRCVGDPAMMVYLGGPESPEKIAERQKRYEKPDSKQFAIVVEATGERVGWVGCWEREWKGDEVYEIGWAVVPEFQGQGIAGAATLQAIDRARAEGKRRYLCAYPSVENGPSNAICRKLGFTFVGSTEYEYPKGHPITCNDWRLDLFAADDAAPATAA